MAAEPETTFQAVGPALGALWQSASFKHLLEPGEVGRHGTGVSPKVLVGHARAPPKREHHVTPAFVCNHPQRVVDDFT